MYDKQERAALLDLWFEVQGTMTPERFVEQMGWPNSATLRRWINEDPRHDPDKATFRSRTVFSKLELIKRVSEGVPCAVAGRELGFPSTTAFRLVKLYAEGGTAALLPKATVRARAKMGASKGKGKGKGRSEGKPAPYLEKPAVPPDLPDDPAALKAIIAELQMSNDVLREVLDVLKADPGCDPASLTNKEKAAIVLRLEGRYPVSAACAALGLSRSSYYYALDALTRPDDDDGVDRAVAEAFAEDGESARGYRFVKIMVDGRLGRRVSEKIVLRSMREQGLVVCYRRKSRRRYSSYGGETDAAPPNLLLRGDGTHDFRAAAPNEAWASDITEFKLPGDGPKVYLSPVIDLFDGKPVGWSISTSPNADLANESLARACATLRPGARPLVHTDRGSHYRWPGWKEICARYGLTRSMSRKGTSPDNAAMEGFFGTLKNEFFYGRDWSGYDADTFIALLDAWMARYSRVRLKAFREGGRTVYDTIDGRRRRLKLA